MHRMDATGLRIGLLNNMPPQARARTEMQLRELLGAARPSVQLRRFSLEPDAHHEGLDRLLACELDGLIVTGAVPVAASIEQEPCWAALAQVVQWAQHNTRSTLWSCMAAQIAVFCLDGVARRKLPAKLSGLFACEAAAAHPLLAGMPQRWLVPHSRYNDLDAEELAARGYTILSVGKQVGADMFVKQVGASRFVFMQGHPEYGPDCLYREYRRDVRQFLRRERASHPALPEAYFDPATATALAALRRNAEQRADPALLHALQPGPLPHEWHQAARQLFGGWLSLILDAKAGLGEQARRQTT